MIKGIALSPGVAIGNLRLLVAGPAGEPSKRLLADDEIAKEIDKLKQAIKTAEQDIAQLADLARARLGAKEAAIFEAHSLMLTDPLVTETLVRKIGEEKKAAAWAVAETFDELAAQMAEQDDDYFRERAQDIGDVGQRLLAALTPAASIQGPLAGTIVAARELTPSDTIKLAAAKVAGFISEKGGPTSHIAILARSLGLPWVSGIDRIETVLSEGDTVLVDGHSGTLLVNPTEADKRHYAERRAAAEARRQAVRELRETRTADGRRVEVAANLVSLEEIRQAVEAGADGVGLFRTEFLYFDRLQPPDEDEQFLAYKTVLTAFGDKPVIIRTLDAGGDKPLPYLSLPAEENPFLGIRGIRLSLQEKALFRVQLRALLRAAPCGNLGVMFPMVTNVAEVVAARELMAEALSELQSAAIPCALPRQVGIMVEVPAAALNAEALIQVADFFSIGTNDLTQYVLAADRGNAHAAPLYDSLHPAVLRLIRLVAATANRAGKWTGVCGELAGNVDAIPLLIGLGVQELSMSPGFIPEAKYAIINTAASAAEGLAAQAEACGDPAAVRRLLS